MPPTARKVTPPRARPRDPAPDTNSTRVPPFVVTEESPPDQPNIEDVVSPPKHSPLYGKLVQFYGSIGMAVSVVDTSCGFAIAANAESTAEAWDELAKQNPQVKRVLTSLMQTGAWSAVIAAHLPVMLAVMAHHRPDLAARFIPAMPNMTQQQETPAA